MVEGARLGFGPRIHDVFEDPRSHIVYEDAKTYFAATRQAYDLIVSEPSNPWVSGVASLFSDEFYGHVVRYLRPDGYFTQWLQTYESNIGVVTSIMKALSRHFGAYQVYNLNDTDILIVATRAATLPLPDAQILQWPRLHAELDRIGVQSTADLHWRLIGDRHMLDALFSIAAAPANSDFFPFVDLNAARFRYLGTDAFELPELTVSTVPFVELLRPDAFTGPTLEPSPHSALLRDQQVRRALSIRRALLDGRLDDVDATTAAWLQLVEASHAACADAAGESSWKLSLELVSARTAQYLSPGELADVWDHIRATPCYHAATGDQRDWADLLAAIAARDTTQVVTLGTRLMRQPDALRSEELTYLATVVATAYLHDGQPQQARALLVPLWGRLDHSGALALSLRELLALAINGSRTSAQTRAGGSSG